MSLDNFLLLMIMPVGALVIAAVLFATTDRKPHS